MIVVSDASPLNVLVRIGLADLLPVLFGRLFVPPAVAFELSHERTPDQVREWFRSAPAWLEVRAPTTIDLSLDLDDPGELEAISLALELRAELLLVDDRKARRIARERGLTMTGALGVLEIADAKSLINLPEALERLRGTDFFIADELWRAALERHQRRKAERQTPGKALPPPRGTL